MNPDARRFKTLLAGMFREALGRLDLNGRMASEVSGLFGQYRDIRVVALGKAAAEMAASFDALIGPGRSTGIVATTTPAASPRPNFRYFVGGHPYPNAQSFQAAGAALDLLEGAGEDCSVVFLISGGGSAALEKPLFDDISLDDAAEFHRALVTVGANIYEMNVLRKHFSAVKGGRLAVAACPARQVTFYVSDVPPGRPSTIASGPTMPDESTAAECDEIVARYGLLRKFPSSYRVHFERSSIPETPKPGDPRFANSRYVALLSNQDGVDALLDLARARGWAADADISPDDWPMERAAEHLLGRLRAMPVLPERPACLISGGELSCPVTGDGVGGRNQAFVLYCAMKIAGEKIAVLSGGTDGVDGNSPAAGAVADGSTVERARAAGLDPRRFYERSDSHSFFSSLEDTIVTGPTGNNVRDLRILLAF